MPKTLMILNCKLIKHHKIQCYSDAHRIKWSQLYITNNMTVLSCHKTDLVVIEQSWLYNSINPLLKNRVKGRMKWNCKNNQGKEKAQHCLNLGYSCTLLTDQTLDSSFQKDTLKGHRIGDQRYRIKESKNGL